LPGTTKLVEKNNCDTFFRMAMVVRVRDAKARAEFPRLALVVIGLVTEAATLGWLIYSFVF
jgi:hypothetical protein